MRILGIRLPIVLAVLLTGATLAPCAQARSSSHPYFDDQGTLNWYHSLREAGQAATREGKVIFVEYGRRRCTQCRVVVNRILPDPRIRARLSKVAVGLAAECDNPEMSVDRVLRTNLRHARMLPFCAFLTPDGQYITGWAGGTGVERFLAHLRKAEAHVQRYAAPAPRPRVRPAPRPTPRPTPRPEQRPEQRRPAPDTTRRGACEEARPQATPPPTPAPKPVQQPRNRYPEPSLVGSPDAADTQGGCGAPLPRVRRSGPLPPPRIIINPPRRVAHTTRAAGAPSKVGVARPANPPARRTFDASPPAWRLAEEAAKQGEWGKVLHLSGAQPADANLARLRQRAHDWAQQRLDQAVDAVAAGRYDQGISAVEDVLVQMQGQPAAIDAERGLEAIRTVLELRFLSPDGLVAPAVRRKAHEDLRGTRWARLFA